jgi:hypothetical protein
MRMQESSLDREKHPMLQICKCANSGLSMIRDDEGSREGLNRERKHPMPCMLSLQQGGDLFLTMQDG